LVGSRTSAAAKVTLFQASLAKRDPTIAAPIIGSMARPQSPVPQNLAKLAAATSGWRKNVNPPSTRAASAPIFATLKTVWMFAPSVTPLMLIAVSTAIISMATTRWGERPSWIASAAPGRCSWPNGKKTSGVTDGTSTPRKRANATATAAMVPVWITAKRVQP
jgi:hypothetical protein